MQKTTSENQHAKHADDAALNLVSILFRNKGLLVISAVVGLTLGVCYFFFLPPKYESRAELLLMRNDSGSIASEMAARKAPFQLTFWQLILS